MADNNLNNLEQQSIRAQQEATSAQNQFVEKQKVYQQLLNELAKSGQLNLKEGADLAKVEKLLNQVLQERIRQEQLRKKIVDEVTKNDKKLAEVKAQEANVAKARVEQERKILEQETRERNKFSNKIKSWSWWTGEDSSNVGLQAIRSAEKISGGIDSIFSGNFLSGAKEIGSAFPKIAKLMGGPLSIAIQATISGLTKLDKGFASFRKNIVENTGGVYSPFLGGNRTGTIIDNATMKIALRHNYGYDDKISELSATAIQSSGLGRLLDSNNKLDTGRLAFRAINQAASYNYLGSLGVQQGSIDKLFSIYRNLEGRSENSTLAKQYRLSELFKRSNYMSINEGVSQSISLYEQTKSLGTNFDWAAQTVKKFDKALQLGEVSLNDFASVTKSIRGADTGRATGIAAMIKDIAIRNGIELPKEFMGSSDLGAGLYLQTRKGLGDKNIQKAIKLLGLQIQSGMSLGSTEYDQARGLQMILQGIFGSSISPEMALDIQQGGNWASILGGKSNIESNEGQDANELRKNARKYYTNGLSFMEEAGKAFKTLADWITTGAAVTVSNPIEAIKIVPLSSLGGPAGTLLGLGLVGRNAINQSMESQKTIANEGN